MIPATEDVKLASTMYEIRHFLPPLQAAVIRTLVKGEEWKDYYDRIMAVADIIKSMPKTRESDGDAVAHLHYFGGGTDFFMVERDIGDTLEGDGMGPQDQAYGWCSIHGVKEDGEYGYVMLKEMFSVGHIELDLHWTPKPVAEAIKE